MNTNLLDQPIPEVPAHSSFHFEFEDFAEGKAFEEMVIARQIVLGLGCAKAAAKALGKSLDELTARDAIEFNDRTTKQIYGDKLPDGIGAPTPLRFALMAEKRRSAKQS